MPAKQKIAGIGAGVMGMASITLYVLAFMGCVSPSPGLENLFILQLQRANSEWAVRSGYFGVCLGEQGEFDCIPSTGRSPETLAEDLENTRFEELIGLAMAFQARRFVALLIVGAVLFFLGFIMALLTWMRGSSGAGSKATNIMKKVALGLAGGSALMTLISAISINQVGAAVSFATRLNGGEIIASTGVGLHVLQWTVAVANILYAAGLAMSWPTKRGYGGGGYDDGYPDDKGAPYPEDDGYPPEDGYYSN